MRGIFVGAQIMHGMEVFSVNSLHFIRILRTFDPFEAKAIVAGRVLCNQSPLPDVLVDKVRGMNFTKHNLSSNLHPIYLCNKNMYTCRYR